MHASRPLSQTDSLCLLLVYVLVASLCAPFMTRRAEAAPADGRVVRKASKPAAKQDGVAQGRWREGEVLARFTEGAPSADVDSLLQANGAERSGRLRGQSGVERLRLSPGADPALIAAELRSSSLVALAEPNYLVTADEIKPDDPRFPEQWALLNTGEAGGQFGADVRAAQAWALATGSARTVVAVIDTGVDFTHSDLRTNRWSNPSEQPNGQDDDGDGFADDVRGWDFVADSGEIIDGQGHGTAVAGVIAARGNNATGVTGVMWRAGLMSLRVLDSTGTGDIARAVEAIDYAAAHGAQVINCSWGSDDNSVALKEAIDRAARRGVVVVASAGNAGRDVEAAPRYPASYESDNLISVASSDGSDLMAQWSNWGATHVAIAAPGTEILTTKAGGDYQSISGTSASAPLVAGVAGLIKTQRPWLGASRTRELILQSARQVQSLSGKVSSGGVLDAGRALDASAQLPIEEGRDQSGGNNGGRHGTEDSGANAGGINAGLDENDHSNLYRVEPPARTQGAPGEGLPNLDELRRHQPTEPQTHPAAPSTRCSPHNPRCDADSGQIIRAADHGLIALMQSLPFHSTDNSLLSDSPVRLGWEPGSISSNVLSVLSGHLLNLAPAAPLPQAQAGRINVALATNGAVATASSQYSTAFAPAGAINGDHRGTNWQTTGGGWADGTAVHFPEWLQVEFNGTKTIDEIDVFTLQDGFGSAEPTETMNFTQYGITAFDVQYWDGSAWVTVPYGSITDNDRVWRKFVFSPVPTTKIRVTVNNALASHSRIVEVEAYANVRQNVALAANGATASATSQYSAIYAPPGAINGDHRGTNWQTTGGGWADGTAIHFPETLTINFNGTKTIDEIDVYTLQDGFNTLEPTDAMTFTQYGITSFDVQYLVGTSTWVTVPGGSITGNNKVWRKFVFSPVTTASIRVTVNAALASHSRIIEVEAYEYARENVALSSNGGLASASSQYSAAYAPAGANNGDRKGLNWQTTGGGWADSPTVHFPEWLQIDFDGTKTIDEIDVVTLQDGFATLEPTETMLFTQYGITAFDVQYLDGSTWVTIPGGSVTGNNRVWRKFTFAAVTTASIRVTVNAALASHSRIVELEAWGTDAPRSITSASDFSNPRLEPENRTGQSGVDPLSGNVGWSVPIISLPGRAGLDLGLALSYNSQVWTKSRDGNSILFDADRGFPGPGFRLGFPTIQGPYFNPEAGLTAYILITPSGTHVELLHTGDGVYESFDSSYLQMTAAGGGMTLRPTDGSQLSYVWINGEYRCVQIKDRNGNYITAEYDPVDGRILKVIDTLARQINFNYDGSLNLNTITQSWNGAPHTWATFLLESKTLTASFTNLSVLLPQNSSAIPVLTKVSFADGTHYKFVYNTSGQVNEITHHAADAHQLSKTNFTLTASAGDCPRVTEQKVQAEYWTGVNGLPSEATTTFDRSTPGEASVTLPDGTVNKSFFATSGWQKGLVNSTEVWSNGTKQNWTTAAWTQDQTTLSYQKNPRMTEIKIFDGTSTRRTTIGYTKAGADYDKWNLPYEVREYATNTTTVLRTTRTDYKLDAAYTDTRHIIALVSAVEVWDGDPQQSGSTLQAKTAYDYDIGTGQLVATSAPTAQHDAAYGTSFIQRGNLTAVSRYDVINTGSQPSTVTRIGYDTNGSVVFTKDALGRQTDVSYADSFSDTTKNSLNTFAYPTTVTPPTITGETAAHFATTTKYNYDFGATTEAKGSLPAGQTQHPTQTYEYDTAGRISKITTGGTYTRWDYHPAGHVSTYTLMVAAAQPISAVEAFSTTIFDGLGRVRGTGGDHPGSTGGFRAQYTRSDIMGRVWQTSNPVEVNSAWAPTGSPSSWPWTMQTYDWKGRPRVKTNPDGTTSEITYAGCGCAGGEVATARDEMGRQQRITSDILGRVVKTEILNEDTDPTDQIAPITYSSTTNTYNARDQFVSVVETAVSSGATQTTTLTYDGYGRLKSQQTPQQAAAGQTVAGEIAYNADDTVSQKTDGRDAVTAFTYNVRRQVTNVTYTPPPNSGIAATASVTYTYDAAGNRTSMDDGPGQVTYTYNGQSQLVSETRTFDGISDSNKRSRTLEYEYTLWGALQKIKDPFNDYVLRTYDSAGRITAVTGSIYANVTQYVSNVKYEAWGGVKEATFGDGNSSTTSYDDRMHPATFRLTGAGGSSKLREDFSYYADGRVQKVTDLDDVAGSNTTMSRRYEYDHLGRVILAGGVNTSGNPTPSPFHQTYTYDAFSNMTSRSGTYGYVQSQTDSATYTNNKRSGWTYDADGRLKVSPSNTTSPARDWTYDAAGRLITTKETSPIGTLTTLTNEYDGDGQMVYESVTVGTTPTSYYMVRSSVLGGEIVSRVTTAGNKFMTYVTVGRLVSARQAINSSGQEIQWSQFDPTGFTEQGTSGVAAYDPLGNYAPRPAPPQGAPPPPSPTGYYGPIYNGASSLLANANNFSTGCLLDGKPTNCSELSRAIDNGMAAECRNNNCGPQPIPGGGWLIFTGSQFWASNGKDFDWIPLDAEIEFRDASDPASWAMSFGPDKKKKKKRARRGNSPFSIISSIATTALVTTANQAYQQPTADGQLSGCLRDALRPFFPAQTIQGKNYSTVDDARFKPGVPLWARPFATAITLGLYDIHYNQRELNIGSGNLERLATVIEELSHAEQFLNMWANMAPIWTIVPSGATVISLPTYQNAQFAWGRSYVFEMYVNYKAGRAPYNNYTEYQAKLKAFNIATQLMNTYNQQGGLCGFNFTGTIQQPTR